MKKNKREPGFLRQVYFLLYTFVFLCQFLQFTSLKSQVKYNIYCKKELLKLSENYALAEQGVFEITPNSSPKIRQYLQSVGLQTPNPYCAAGVYYCFSKAAKKLKLTEKDIPISKTASTRLMYNKAKKNNTKVPFLAAEHDLIFWKRGNTYWGHIERVIKVENSKAGWVKTIAFNTKCKICDKKIFAQKEVEGVCIKRRNVKHILGRLSILGLIGFYS